MNTVSRAPSESPRVLCSEVPAGGDYRVGFAQLSAERSLNALSLDMIRLLDAQLRRWANDPRIVCVVLHGAGEKAFCAGGDIRSLYRALTDEPHSTPNPAALTFFAEEYRLDHLLHRYPKPLLVWGSGIVFGGGLGLMAGGSHRVVTETSRLAMPEISIGLFPDVGGSDFLRHMPGRSGLFLALTGAHINGHDAIAASLADHFLRSQDRDLLFARLLEVTWSRDVTDNHGRLSALLDEFAAEAAPMLPTSLLLQHADRIESLCAGESLHEIVARIVACAGDDEWLQRAARTLAAGSPTTAALSWELRHRAGTLDLAGIFRMELIVAVQCCAHPDFIEGVRALLIDKDHAPRWTPATLAEVTPQWIAEHFAEPWPKGEHPLSDL